MAPLLTPQAQIGARSSQGAGREMEKEVAHHSLMHSVLGVYPQLSPVARYAHGPETQILNDGAKA